MEKNQPRILLAEDDHNLGNILKNFLDVKGYTTTLCINGQEAVDIFQKKEFDFCILDIMMPDIDGYEVCRKLKLNPNTSHIPVIFVTARTGQEHIERGLSLGAQGYITKPFKPDELIDKLAEVTGSS